MKKIMFVCHGNICRSPMAEFIMKKLISDAGLADKYYVASSATSTEEIGNPVYPPAMTELMKHGIRCVGKRSVQLKRADADEYDLFIGMDDANIRNIHRMLGDAARGKVYKMMSFVGSDDDVADPWFFDGFDKTCDDCYKACTALLELLEGNKI